MITSTGNGYIWEDFTEDAAIWKELGGHSKWKGQPWASGVFRELLLRVHDQMPGRRKSQMMLAWCLGEDIWIFVLWAVGSHRGFKRGAQWSNLHAGQLGQQGAPCWCSTLLSAAPVSTSSSRSFLR